jgi:hypothetical protein
VPPIDVEPVYFTTTLLVAVDDVIIENDRAVVPPRVIYNTLIINFQTYSKAGKCGRERDPEAGPWIVLHFEDDALVGNQRVRIHTSQSKPI